MSESDAISHRSVLQSLEDLKVAYEITKFSPKTLIRDIKNIRVLELLQEFNLNSSNLSDVNIYKVRIGKFAAYDFCLEGAFDEALECYRQSKRKVNIKIGSDIITSSIEQIQDSIIEYSKNK